MATAPSDFPTRPDVLAVNPEGIPDELKAESRWLLWRVALRNGKRTKVPYSAHGGPGDSTKPATWSSFDEAHAAYLTGNFSGLGFALGAGFVGVDLDHVRNPATGALTDDGALDIVMTLASFTEASPSGEGVHVIARGVKPSGRSRKGHVEMYDAGRFFTVTGDRLLPKYDVREATDAIQHVWEEYVADPVTKDESPLSHAPSPPADDSEVRDVATKAKNGAKLRALLAGDISAYRDEDGREDHSKAQFALVGLLAFYTQDVEQLVRLVIASKLYRNPDDERKLRRHDIPNILAELRDTFSGPWPSSYRRSETPHHAEEPNVEPDAAEADADEQDDNTAKATPQENESPRGPGAGIPECRADDLLSRPLPNLTYLPVLGRALIIVKGWSHMLAAAPKAGKTTLLAHVFGEWVEAGESIRYITEESEHTWHHRLQAIGISPDVLHEVHLSFGLGQTPEALLAHAERCKESVVVVDTIRSLLAFEDEKDNSEAARKLGPWVAAMRSGMKTLIFVHHNRKGGGEHGEGISGGHALLASVDIAIIVTRDRFTANRRRIETLGRIVEPLEFMYEYVDGVLNPLGDPSQLAIVEVRQRILEVLEQGKVYATAAVRGLLDEPHPSERQVLNALNDLAKMNKLVRDPSIDKDAAGKRVTWKLVEVQAEVPLKDVA